MPTPQPDSSSPSQSGSSTVDSKTQSPTSADELGDTIDLTSCCNVNFEMRDGCPGVRYQDSDNVAGSTPVVGRQRKQKRLPDFVLRRFPPDHPMQKTHQDSGSQSDVAGSEDEELTIPTGANMRFDIYEGTPGLQIQTSNTSRWTPIASRTRSKFKA